MTSGSETLNESAKACTYSVVPTEEAKSSALISDSNEPAPEDALHIHKKRWRWAVACLIAVLVIAAMVTTRKLQTADTGALMQKVTEGVHYTVETNMATSCGLNLKGYSISTNAATKFKDLYSQMDTVGVPDSILDPFADFIGVFEDLTPEASYAIAIGDFDGNWMTSTVSEDSTQVGVGLNNMFVYGSASDNVWGTFGMYLDIPCMTKDPISTETMQIAFIFNSCGDQGMNWMASFNPSILQCSPTLMAKPGVGEVIEEIIALAGEATFGISLDGKFGKQIKLAHATDGKVSIETLDMTGHLALAGSVEIDLGKILDCSFLEDILGGEVQFDVLVSFDSLPTDLIAGLKTLAKLGIQAMPDLFTALALYVTEGETAAQSQMTSSFTGDLQGDATTAVTNVIGGLGGATFMLEQTGKLTFDLSEKSGGIFPDLSITLSKQIWILKTSAAISDRSDVKKLAPGYYTWVECDLGSYVQTFVKSAVSQIDGLLSVFNVDIDQDWSFDAGVGMGLFISTDAFGFATEFKLASVTVTVNCFLLFSGPKLKCEINGNWGEILWDTISGIASMVMKTMTDWAENGAEEVAEWAASAFLSSAEAILGKSLVNKGKKIWQRHKCRALGFLSDCKKNSNTPSHCGDGTEYVLRTTTDDVCVGVTDACTGTTWSSACKPALMTCTWYDSDWDTQMKSFWYFTSDAKLCSEYINEHYYEDIDDPDNNPACVKNSAGTLSFVTESEADTMSIVKKDTERFRIQHGDDVDACWNADDGSDGDDVNVGTEGERPDRRRRRRNDYCSKGTVQEWRIYQKLGDGACSGDACSYEKENGDNQFTCSRRLMKSDSKHMNTSLPTQYV